MNYVCLFSEKRYFISSLENKIKECQDEKTDQDWTAYQGNVS